MPTSRYMQICDTRSSRVKKQSLQTASTELETCLLAKAPLLMILSFFPLTIPSPSKKLDGIVRGMKDGEWSDLKHYLKCTKLPNCIENSKYSVLSKTRHVVFVIKLLLCKCMLSRRNDTNWSLVGEMTQIGS